MTPEATAIFKKQGYDTPWGVNTGTGGDAPPAAKPFEQPSIKASNAATIAKPPQQLPQGAVKFNPLFNKKTGRHEAWIAVDAQNKPMGQPLPVTQ
jgi:hypothetical protein